MAPTHQAFGSAILFSGGGTRFAVYGGMFAACEDAGQKPELIIAACGGAMAAAIIRTFPTADERKAYFKSEEFYSFMRMQSLTSQRYLHRLPGYCLKKSLCRHNAPTIEDVFTSCLIDLTPDLSSLLPSLAPNFDSALPTIIVGSELLFDESMTGESRRGRKLYRKVLMTDAATSAHIPLEYLPPLYGQDSAVASDTTMMTGVSLPTAVRISISDMFYVRPVEFREKHYAGGAIDLIPLELAHAIAGQCLLERKPSYRRMEEALVRAVLGFSGNARLQSLTPSPRDISIDTRDILSTLDGHYVQKRISPASMQIKLHVPPTLSEWGESIELQWQYGYAKTREALRNHQAP